MRCIVFFLILGLGLFPTALAYIMYTYGLQYIEASKAAILSTIEPVVATIMPSRKLSLFSALMDGLHHCFCILSARKTKKCKGIDIY